MESWRWFFFLTLLCILTQSFFAMLEMACVSFNKVRLQYYINNRYKRAVWLNYLLNHPALLFGTTLIAVNASLLIGSECSRRFYESVGVSPTLAPFTQAFLVLVFAEVAPMFAGRYYAEHAALIGVPILYVLAILLKPFIWMIDQLCRGINRLCGTPLESNLYLTREELQHVIESREEKVLSSEQEQLDSVISNIFSLKNKTAKELMHPLKEVKMLPVGASLLQMRQLIKKEYSSYVPLFHKDEQNIVAIAYPRDLLRLADHKRIRDLARSPWFITETTSILQIVKQFRKNNQSIAVVLNDSGHATGILTLDEIIDEIFETKDLWMAFGDVLPKIHSIMLDRTFPGDLSLQEFRTKYQLPLHFKQAQTLAEVMELALGHVPRAGESVRVDQFELTAEEVTLLGPKTILVRTLF